MCWTHVTSTLCKYWIGPGISRYPIWKESDWTGTAKLNQGHPWYQQVVCSNIFILKILFWKKSAFGGWKCSLCWLEGPNAFQIETQKVHLSHIQLFLVVLGRFIHLLLKHFFTRLQKHLLTKLIAETETIWQKLSSQLQARPTTNLTAGPTGPHSNKFI